MIETILGASLWKVALISGIPLAACAATGLVLSILQAATQIQEQTILYAVKFFTVSVIFLFFGPWFLTELLNLAQETLGMIAHVSS